MYGLRFVRRKKALIGERDEIQYLYNTSTHFSCVDDTDGLVSSIFNVKSESRILNLKCILQKMARHCLFVTCWLAF